MLELLYKMEEVVMTKYEGLSTMYGAAKLVKAEDKFEDETYSDESPVSNPKSDYIIKEQYMTDWENSEWENVDFKINKVKVTGENDTEDTTMNYSYLSFRYTLDNRTDREVVLKPETAWVILENGHKIESSTFTDTWENIFSKHKKKFGHIHFNFGTTNELENIKGVYVKFSGYFKDDKESKVTHVYEVPLYL